VHVFSRHDRRCEAAGVELESLRAFKLESESSLASLRAQVERLHAELLISDRIKTEASDQVAVLQRDLDEAKQHLKKSQSDLHSAQQVSQDLLFPSSFKFFLLFRLNLFYFIGSLGVCFAITLGQSHCNGRAQHDAVAAVDQ
jgi:hypothetical protein